MVGKFIRVKVGWVQKLFLPSSIMGGALILLLGPQVLGQLAGGDFADGGLFPPEMLKVWSSLPGILISVVFATMFLGQELPSFKRAAHLMGPQVALGVSLGSGQYVVGLLITALILVPFFSANPMVGALIEIGFEGGHGTAAGMRPVFEKLGFASGADLAVGVATVGIVAGVVLGIILINWAVRSGHTEILKSDVKASVEEQKGLFRKDEHYPAGRLTSRPASVEPLSLHMSIVAVSILVGWGILEALRWIEQQTYASVMLNEDTNLEIFSFVPLFPLALLGGVIVQSAAKRMGMSHIIDDQMMLRIQGLALDFLIVAAIGTLSIQAIGANLESFLLLCIGGILLNVTLLLLFAPRVIGRYWFERGIGDFGQSMGVTATGLILMRITDPRAESPAFEAFGYKQLVFEPFFGGGLVTAMAVPVIALSGPWPLFTAMLVIFLIAVVGGLIHFGPTAKAERAAHAAQSVPAG